MKFARVTSFMVLFILLPIIKCQTADDESRDDDSTYVQGSIQAILANLSSGIEVNGQEVSINPLRDPGPFAYNVNILRLRFEVIATNNVFRGLTDAKVSNTQVNNTGPNTVIYFETFIPSLTHTTNFSMVGTVQSLIGFGEIRLNETGPAVFTYHNTEIKHKITLRKVCQKWTEVWKVVSYRVKFHSNEVNGRFGNLFGGRNAILANALTALIDKYEMKIVEQIGPEIDCVYSKVFGKLARLLLNGHPTKKSCSR